MASVILIRELAENQREIVHEAHASWDTTVQTIRETHSMQKGVKVTLGTKRVHGNVVRLPLHVMWVEGDEDKRVNYLLTEMDLHTEVSHL